MPDLFCYILKNSFYDFCKYYTRVIVVNIINYIFFLYSFNSEEYYVISNISDLIYLIVIIKRLS